MWPAIAGANSTNPHADSAEPDHAAWVPTSEWSILMQLPNGTIMKLITQGERSNRFTADGKQPKDTAPCVNTKGKCMVCTDTAPCLFDVSVDPSEHNNIASSCPALVGRMSAKLATYKVYVAGKMAPAELSNYHCDPHAKGKDGATWWGNYSGPCCKPLSSSFPLSAAHTRVSARTGRRAGRIHSAPDIL